MQPEELIRELLVLIGDNPTREGLLETPKRVVKSYKEIFSGYSDNAANHMTIFQDDTSDEMVVLRNVEFVSFCEHHMLPFYGRAHIAYLPNGQVIGISKLARILEVFTKRLQIQERIGSQVTDAIDEFLKPLGSACVIEAKHTCMSCRGVLKQHSEMVTSSLSGVFKTDPMVRAEFLGFVR